MRAREIAFGVWPVFFAAARTLYPSFSTSRMPSRHSKTGRLLRLEVLFAVFIYSSIPKNLLARHRHPGARSDRICFISDVPLQSRH